MGEGSNTHHGQVIGCSRAYQLRLFCGAIIMAHDVFTEQLISNPVNQCVFTYLPIGFSSGN
jgi:hypothetical protein